MKAIVMAGGEGTRLRPLTCAVPKPMVTLLDKPMLAYVTEHLLRHGISEMALTLGYLPSVVTNWFEENKPQNTHMEFFIEDVPLGTAGSVKNAAPFIDGTFLIVSGDALTDIDLTAAVQAHKAGGAMATIVLKRLGSPLEYGVVITSDDGGVERFVEKPGWEDVFSDTVNTGIYVLEPEVLDLIPSRTQFDFAKNVFPLMMSKGMPIYGYVADGYWCDVGNIESYIKAHEDILKGAVQVNILGRNAGGIWVGEGASISNSALIQSPSFVGAGAVIGDGAKIGRYACVGAGSRVGAYANLKRCVLHKNARVGRHAKLSGCVVAENSAVGERSSVYEGAVVGERSCLSGESRVAPRVRIWPEKQISAGTVVGDNIVWGGGERTGFIGRGGFVGDVGVDLTPLRLAKIFGAVAEHMSGKRVALCTDGSPLCCAALKQAAGMLTMSGVDVLAMKSVLRPVCASLAQTLDAGLCVMLHAHKQKLYVDLFEPELFMLSKQARRKIEAKYFAQGEQLSCPETGQQTWVDLADRFYLSAVTQKVDWSAVKVAGLKVIVAGGRDADALAAGALESCGARVSRFHGEAIGRVVQDEEAAFGARMSKNGQVGMLYFPDGRVLGPEECRTLAYYLVMNGLSGSEISLPSGVTRGVVTMADVLGLTYSFTSEEEAAASLAVDARRILFDGIFMLCRFAEHLARTGLLASEIGAMIEPPHMKVKAVGCDWEDIGRVIGGVYAQGSAVASEGLRLDVAGGYGYICPHATRPTIIIRTEADTEEFATELCEKYTDMVRRILKQPKDGAGEEQ
jgi:mannose-1-phosphate guanylyltransferase/phosphomannomutase